VYYVLNASLPEYEGTLYLSELEAPVTVSFDALGIPQVWAQKENDMWFVLGWLHAQERLFQMEMTRRIASGRLAEMFGSEVISIDQLQRKFGHRRMAERALLQLDQRIEQKLSAYTNGINAWIDHTTILPFEFLLLNVEIEPWIPLDCIAVYSFQTWYSDYIQNNDALYSAMERQFGPDKAKELDAEYPLWAPTTVSMGFNPFINQDGIANASNGWVIAPQKSASGAAVLASDPHLDIYRLPQFWFAVGLHCQESDLNVFGVTTPALPYFAYGHNGRAAWAFTAGGVDVTDEYIEQLHPEDPFRYRTPDGWQKMDRITEEIYIKDEDYPQQIEIESTRHGPVIRRNDSLHYAHALHWAGFDVSLVTAMSNGFKALNTSDFEAFRSVVTQFGALNANWIYADKNGVIGYQLGTPIPIRNYTKNQFVLPGWDKQYDWDGYHPLENTPWQANPQNGWLATCNNKPAVDQIDYVLYGNFAPDRILRISELLESKNNLNRSDLKNFQSDFKSSYLLRWSESGAQILESLDEFEEAESVRNWSGEFAGDSHPAILIKCYLFYLKILTFNDELHEMRQELENPHVFRDIVMEKVYFKNLEHWFDDIGTTDSVETRETISREAMRMALAEVKDKSLGDLQFLTQGHPFSQNAVLDFLFDLSRGPFSRAGTNSTLNATTARKNPDGGFDVLVGPSMRLIIDFSDLNQTTVVFPAGQSGHPLSDHFFDFYELWSTDAEWTVPFERELVINQAESELRFIPVKK
jgi:penicillin amidase